VDIEAEDGRAKRPSAFQ